jgi:hypothetical protein
LKAFKIAYKQAKLFVKNTIETWKMKSTNVTGNLTEPFLEPPFKHRHSTKEFLF